MRYLTNLAASALLFASHATFASASLAYVLTFDPETAQSKHKISLSSLSPETARMVFAQRAGVEDHHTLSGVNSADMEAINTYGAKTSMFESKTQQRAFLLAELEPGAESNAMLRMHAKFTVQDPPSFSETKEFFQDLFQQSHPTKPMKSSYLTNKQYLRSMESPMFHITSDAQALVEMARDLAGKKMAVTALLVPSGDRDGDWGGYTMPERKDRPKRQVLHSLFEETEELLSEAGEALGIPSTPIVQLKASNSSSNYSNASPLKGILPSCFSSEKQCISDTRDCTGHGTCKLKYTNPDKQKPVQCWSCECGSTKKDGLTTVWAGPACQKKDISMEFWLIALFTVGLVSAVTFAVGNLWSMGEQELPSVIGAGVSGPTARK